MFQAGCDQTVSSVLNGSGSDVRTSCGSLLVAAGGRRQRSARRSGSRPTASSCSCSRRPSRRPSTSRWPRTHCVCRTAPCTPCRTSSPGPRTLQRSAACLPASSCCHGLHLMERTSYHTAAVRQTRAAAGLSQYSHQMGSKQSMSDFIYQKHIFIWTFCLCQYLSAMLMDFFNTTSK